MSVDSAQYDLVEETAGSDRLSFLVWRLALLCCALAVSGALGYLAYTPFAPRPPLAARWLAVSVQPGTLVATVRTTGSVVNSRGAQLSFSGSGRVKAVLVGVGDQVKAAQPLVTLEADDLQAGLAQAQSNLRMAQIRLKQLNERPSADAIAAARAALAAANARLAQVKAGPAEADLRAAEHGVARAEAALQEAKATLAAFKMAANPAAPAPTSPSARPPAEQETPATRVEQPVSTQVAAPGDKQPDARPTPVTSAGGAPSAGQVAAAELAVASAQAEWDAARARLTQVRAGPTVADVKSAEQAVASAQAVVTAMEAGPRESDLALQQEQVKQAEVAVGQARAAVEAATLRAPFDGAVASVGVAVGEGVTPGAAAVRLVDPQTVRVDAGVAEADVSGLKVGQRARLTLDSYPERPYTGKVAALAPEGVLQQGIVTFPVSVALDKGQPPLPAGLTASVTIFVGERHDALVVPNAAISVEDGRRMVQVLVAGRPQARAVSVGLSNDQVTEVREGLAVGDEVLIAQPGPDPSGHAQAPSSDGVETLSWDGSR